MTVDMMINESSHFRGNLFRIQCLFSACISIILVSCAASNTQQLKKKEPGFDRKVSTREYNDSGLQIVHALGSGNAEAFTMLLNKQVILYRAFQGMPENSHISRARTKLDSVLDQAGIVMTENLGEKTQLTFVKTRLVKDEYRALVRVNMGDRGLSYIDFILDKDDSGMVKIIDWHDYAQGQLYSESLRQALVFMLPRDDSLFATLLGESWVDSDSFGKISELARLARQRNYTAWLEKYRTLPDRLKYSRIVLVTRALIASASGSEDEYRSALREVSTHFGDDPSLSLMLLDHYLSERDYAAAHRSLETLRDYTGGDAAIHLLKANVCLTEKDYPESIRHAQIAIHEDDTLEEAYWALLAVSVYSNKYDIAVNTLRRLEQNFGYSFDPDRIARIKGYDQFARSSIFADWKYGLLP